MDTAQWPQEVMVKQMEDKISKTCSSSVVTAATSSSNNNKLPSTSLERKIRPQKDEAVNCPRCNSTNTKFCYYNNYSLTQPRYFCKTCKRYWTEGGSLRNIPVGGGSRKNKRSSSSSTCTSSSPPASKRMSSHDLVAASQSHHLISNPNHHHQQSHHDLNLGFPPTQLHHDFTTLSQFIQLPTTPNPNNTSASVDQHLSALELLNGLTSPRGLTPFIPMSVPDPHDNGGYSSGYPSLQEFKPSLNFSLDGFGNNNNNNNNDNNDNGFGSLQNGGGRHLFPFEDLKQTTTATTTTNDAGDQTNNNENEEESRDEQGDSTTNGFWSGMLGAGGSW